MTSAIVVLCGHQCTSAIMCYCDVFSVVNVYIDHLK